MVLTKILNCMRDGKFRTPLPFTLWPEGGLDTILVFTPRNLQHASVVPFTNQGRSPRPNPHPRVQSSEVLPMLTPLAWPDRRLQS